MTNFDRQKSTSTTDSSTIPTTTILRIDMAPSVVTFPGLKASLKAGQYAPVYLLHGEEGYYIDQLVEIFEQIPPEDLRAFNLYQLYAHETTPERVMDACRSFPMMGERQVVILKEAQSARADYLKKLAPYAANPSPTAILVICSRGAAVKSKELLDAIKKGKGIVFESKKLTERTIDPVIMEIVGEHGLKIEAKGLSMLRDFIGTDLSRLYNEIKKLAMVLGPGAMITPESIERNIGISREFNNFELLDALINRNAQKAFTILRYFKSNPKASPTVMTVATLFNYFSGLLIYQYLPVKNPDTAKEALGLKWDSQLRNYTMGAQQYRPRQTVEVISALRRFDAQSKGIGSRQGEYDLLHDLIFRILTL
ncbi:MAG: DNA polymerase III subunit delta [Bacteroidales bacterium]|nr:DNA polymerase III subunit delta [Bacteroidales bacterium]